MVKWSPFELNVHFRVTIELFLTELNVYPIVHLTSNCIPFWFFLKHFSVELNGLGLQPRKFNCQLENLKSQKGYTFNIVKCF